MLIWGLNSVCLRGGSSLKISSYQLEVMTRTWTNILGEFWVHALIVVHVRHWSKKHKPQLKEIELSYLHNSICLNELITLVWSNVKIGWKWPFKVHAKVASWPSLGKWLVILATFLIYGIQICFALICINIDGQPNLKVYQT